MKLQLLGSLSLLLALYHLAPHAEAPEFTSSLSRGELLDRCRQATDILNEKTQQASVGGLAQAAYCAGFVEAAADAGSFLGAMNLSVRQHDGAQLRESIRNCAGPAVRGEELLQVVVQFLESNPDSRLPKYARDSSGLPLRYARVTCAALHLNAVQARCARSSICAKGP